MSKAKVFLPVMTVLGRSIDIYSEYKKLTTLKMKLRHLLSVMEVTALSMTISKMITCPPCSHKSDVFRVIRGWFM